MWLAIRSAALRKNSEPSLPPGATVRILRCAKDGRQLGSLLERIRNHHREHGHLGKRYAEVIRLFDPSFEYGRTHVWQKEASHALLSQ